MRSDDVFGAKDILRLYNRAGYGRLPQVVYEKGSDYEQIVRVAFLRRFRQISYGCRFGAAGDSQFAIEIFSFPPENNYIAPAGRVMEPEEETFSFAAASDTGAKNAPIERIVKQA